MQGEVEDEAHHESGDGLRDRVGKVSVIREYINTPAVEKQAPERNQSIAGGLPLDSAVMGLEAPLPAQPEIGDRPQQSAQRGRGHIPDVKYFDAKNQGAEVHHSRTQGRDLGTTERGPERR